MKVAQSRLEHRSWRPNVELCRDPPQFQLVKEVDLIGQSIDALLAQVLFLTNAFRLFVWLLLFLVLTFARFDFRVCCSCTFPVLPMNLTPTTVIYCYPT